MRFVGVGGRGKERLSVLRWARETGVSRRGGRPLACEKKIGLVSQRWARGDKDAKRRSVLSPGGGQGETNADERRGAFVFFPFQHKETLLRAVS